MQKTNSKMVGKGPTLLVIILSVNRLETSIKKVWQDKKQDKLLPLWESPWTPLVDLGAASVFGPYHQWKADRFTAWLVQANSDFLVFFRFHSCLNDTFFFFRKLIALVSSRDVTWNNLSWLWKQIHAWLISFIFPPNLNEDKAILDKKTCVCLCHIFYHHDCFSK